MSNEAKKDKFYALYIVGLGAYYNSDIKFKEQVKERA